MVRDPSAESNVTRQTDRIIPKVDVPSLLQPVKGCLFVTRCPLAEQSCKNDSRN
jgi:ABC-type dipeptide/oligopeptide/nickel transport system ATPase component